MRSSSISISFISRESIALLLILHAFAPILDYFLGVKYFGLSLFVTILPTFILIFLYILNLNKIKNIYHLLIIINIVLYTFNYLLRSYLYNESSFTIYFTKAYLILIPISAVIFLNSKINTLSKAFAISLLKFIILFNFFNTLFFVLGLPSIIVHDIDSLGYYGVGRYTGVMGGSNIYGVFIYLIFLILTLSSYSNNLFKLYIYFLLSLFAVLPTLSRNAILGVLIVFFLFLGKTFLRLKIISKIFLIITTSLLIFISTLIFKFSSYKHIIVRFIERFESEQLFESRIDRITLAIDSLFYSVNHMLFGIPFKLQHNAEVSISDNTFTHALSNFGIPYTIFFIFFILYLINIKGVNLRMMVYFILIFIILFTNNAYLWTPWVAYTIFGIYVIRK